MTYYGTIGEISLVCALIYISLAWYNNVLITPLLKHAVLLSFALIAVTALLGSVRFAGFNAVIPMHDDLSWLSKHIAMVIYSAGLAYTAANGKTKIAITLVALIGVSQLFGVVMIDASLLVCFLLYITFSQVKKFSIYALLALILVPATEAIPASEDFKMGVFHILLAGHFYLMALSIKTRINTIST